MLLSLIPIPLIVIAMRGFAQVCPARLSRAPEGTGRAERARSTTTSRASARSRPLPARTSKRTGSATTSTATAIRCCSALRLMATFQPFVEFCLLAGHGRADLLWRPAWCSTRRCPWKTWSPSSSISGLLYQPVRALSGAWEGVQEALAGAERVAELLEEEPDVAERPDAHRAGRAVQRARSSFEDVGFRYHARTPTVLDRHRPRHPAGHRWWRWSGRRAWARRRWPT